GLGAHWLSESIERRRTNKQPLQAQQSRNSLSLDVAAAIELTDPTAGKIAAFVRSKIGHDLRIDPSNAVAARWNRGSSNRPTARDSRFEQPTHNTETGQ